MHTLAFSSVDLGSLHVSQKSLRDAYAEAAMQAENYDGAKSLFVQADVVINATPLGMKEDDPPPFDTELLHRGQTVFDVVYASGETLLVCQARAGGAKAYSGLAMLVFQAQASAQVFLDMAHVNTDMTETEMFGVMARAAQFEC
jgi:shikimate dehydrogenase